MYISEISIKGLRNFKDVNVHFHEGMNVIIGHNNTGKSNLLRAIALVLGYNDSRSLRTNDLFYETDVAILKQQSPRIKIALVIHRSKDEELDSDEMALFSGLMTDPALSEEAQLKYEFKLADAQEESYKKDVADATTAKEIWKIIERDYFRMYRSKRSGGKEAANVSDIHEVLAHIDFQFLDAIRDVSHDLYAGYNPLLRDVLNFFIDYAVKNNDSKTEDEIKQQLKTLREAFTQQSGPLMQTLHDRLKDGKNVFLKYAVDTGATFNGAVPDFDGEVTENEMFAVLRMIIKYANGVEVPAIYNGLGYNNLIYMSLLLAKMQADSSIAYMKRNAKVLSFLAIEECEAHLHPAMQYKFLQFLQDNKANGHVRQIFITTHSTQIASAVKLEDLICMSSSEIGKLDVGYPREVYIDRKDVASKQYVQRFLDATKADMFFANKLIFVEGVAEELLLPIFAQYMNKNLTDEHVLVINMGGRYFGHFLKLFDTNNPYTINKKIVCITDVDPCRKKKVPDEEYEACYPFEFNMDTVNYEYKHHADDEVAQYGTHPNIRFFRQDATYGKTLEYDLMRENVNCELLLTESISNKNEIKAMMAETDVNAMMSKMRNSESNRLIKTAVANSGWSDEEKRKSLLASRYLNSVSKGSNALELNVVLAENLTKPAGERKDFHVPQYIIDALTWLLS